MGSATWDGYVSTAWNDPGGPLGTNWNPGGAVPTDTANFTTTPYNHTVNLGIVNTSIGTINFAAGADAYSFIISGFNTNFTLTNGITGDASQQTFAISASAKMAFTSGSASNAKLNVNATGRLQFSNSSDAGTAKINIDNQGHVDFIDTSSAKIASINSSGDLIFWGQSSAGNATINANQGSLIFYNKSTAGTAAIQVYSGVNGTFSDTSSATQATITINNGASVTFTWSATAARSTIDVKQGGTLFMQANSVGDSASVLIEQGGVLDASAHSIGNVYFASIIGNGKIISSADTKVLVGSPPASGFSTAHQSTAGLITASTPFGGTLAGGEFGVTTGSFAFAGIDQSTKNMFTVNGTLELASGAQLAGGLAFEGLSWGNPLLQLDTSALTALTINDMAKSDAVDLRFHAFSAGESAVWTSNAQNSGGKLVIGSGASAVTLSVNGVHASSEFSLISDGAGGTTIIDNGTAITASQAVAALGGNTQYGRVDIVDSLANLKTSLDNLGALGNRIASIALTDQGIQTLNLSAAQSIQDHSALSAIRSALNLSVTANGTGPTKLEGALGNDFLVGGSGLNTAIFNGASTQYTITQTGGGMTVADSVAHRDGTDSLSNIQRVQFTNEVLAFDTNGNAGQAYRMYQAAFARTPDEGGVSFWVSQVDKGMNLHDLAQNFIGSQEFMSVYGASPSVQTLVSGFYTNVLGRAPDASGLAYWIGQVQSGLSTPDLLVQFSESAENKAHVAPAIQNGIDLALSYFA